MHGGVYAPMPPAPRAVRAVAHPDLGAVTPQTQYLQDPTTGRVYQVVLQPVAMAAPQASVEQAQAVAYAAAQPQYTAAPRYTTAAQPEYMPAYPTTAAPTMTQVPAPGIQPLPAVTAQEQQQQVYLTSAAAPVAGTREVELSQALTATQQRADELEGHVRRLEGLVDRLAQQQAYPQAGAPTAQPQTVPSAPAAVATVQPGATPVVLETPAAAQSGNVGGKIRSWFIRK